LIDLAEGTIFLEMTSTENVPTQNENITFSQVRNSVPLFATLKV
jgi:hypothetical protein